MSNEQQAQAEERDRATNEATTYIRAHFSDEEAWVRLLVTEGVGQAMVYHFDAFVPSIDMQSRVTVSRSGLNRWNTVIAG